MNGAANISAGRNDIFVLNVDGSGALTQFARTGTKGNDVGYNLATGPSGVTYLVGGLDDGHLLIAAINGARPLPMPPVVVLQPRDQLLKIGDSIALFTSSIGGAPLDYQWFKSGQPLPWGTAATLYWWVDSIIYEHEAGIHCLESIANEFEAGINVPKGMSDRVEAVIDEHEETINEGEASICEGAGSIDEC